MKDIKVFNPNPYKVLMSLGFTKISSDTWMVIDGGNPTNVLVYDELSGTFQKYDNVLYPFELAQIMDAGYNYELDDYILDNDIIVKDMDIKDIFYFL